MLWLWSLDIWYAEVSWVIGVPPVLIHFRLGFSIINHPAIGDSPFLETIDYQAVNHGKPWIDLDGVARCSKGICGSGSKIHWQRYPDDGNLSDHVFFFFFDGNEHLRVARVRSPPWPIGVLGIDDSRHRSWSLWIFGKIFRKPQKQGKKKSLGVHDVKHTA